MIDRAYLQAYIAELRPWQDGKPLTPFVPAADALPVFEMLDRILAVQGSGRRALTEPREVRRLAEVGR